MTTIELTVVIVGLVLSLLSIFNIYVSLKKMARQPFVEHGNRITALENEVKEIKRTMTNSDNRMDDVEEAVKIILHSIGALLSHGIDGNNDAEMRKARNDLNEFLVDRR